MQKTINLGGKEYTIKEEKELSEDSIEKSPASRADLIALDDKLREIQKNVEDFKKDVPDATNSIGQIMNRLEKIEGAVEEMQDILVDVMPSAHDHAEGDGSLSPEMKYAVLDFLKEVDGLAATDDEFATNLDGTPKREKKKDVRNLTAQGAEVDPNIGDEEMKVLELERKVDALLKTPAYRGADTIEVQFTGGDQYMDQILKAHGM